MYYRRSLGNAFPPVSRSCAGSNGKVVKRRVWCVPLPDHFKELKKLIFLLCAYHYTYSKGDEGKHWKNNSLGSPKSPEKAMAPHSSTLAWKLPWMEEPGGLQSMGSLRVGHDWNDFTFTFHFRALEREMATHSSVLAWRIPGTEEPGRRLSMGSHRVGHDWSDLTALYCKTLKLGETGWGYMGTLYILSLQCF